MKKCPKCNRDLETSNFHKSSIRNDGLQLWCKECGLAHKKYAYHTTRKMPVRMLSRETQLRKYGLSIKDYDELLYSQDGKCDICKRVPTKGGNQFVKNFLVIDHDHSNGKVRGLLCSECNLGISKFEENEQFLLNAIKYLNKHGK